MGRKSREKQERQVTLCGCAFLYRKSVCKGFCVGQSKWIACNASKSSTTALLLTMALAVGVPSPTPQRYRKDTQ